MKMEGKLKLVRKRRNLKLQEMSKLSGVQIATLSRMENGKATGSLKSFIKISKVLGLKLSELFNELEN